MRARGIVTFLASLASASAACTSYTTTGGNGGQGGSQGCTVADECPGTDSYCGQRTCKSGVCGFDVLSPAGTPASTQPVGDCKTLVCDDAGNVVAEADATDVPSDGNACTDDYCDGTSPAHADAEAGTSCGQGLTCDGMGTCIGCDVASDCGQDEACFTWACNNQQCEQSNKANGALCEGACHACQNGTCVVAPAGQDPGDQCAGADTCNVNGACRCGDGAKNGNETDKDCGGDGCDKCLIGKTCLEGGDCASGFCADGVCCNAPCDGTCQACAIDGSVGTCTMIPAGDADPTCGSGTCGIGGFCACMDAGDCVGAEACVQPPNANDSPICFVPLANGEACPGVDEACESGHCVDGVCCESACDQACHSCNLPLVEGFCSVIVSGMDPDSCAGTCTAGVCGN